MAYDSNGRWQDEDAGVASRIAAITSGSSDFMRQARTAGMQAQNRRGLGNSSMAVGAAQGAAIDRAAPIAGQEAQQSFQRNLTEQNFRNQTDLDSMRYAAAERESLARSITDLNSQRMSAFAATLNNDKIPASARAAAQQSINDQAADAYSRLQQLYGVSVSPSAGGTGASGVSGADSYAAYVQSNPDLMAEFARVGSQFGDIAAFGRFHYDTYGRNEGRTLPVAPTAPATMNRVGLGTVPVNSALPAGAAFR